VTATIEDRKRIADTIRQQITGGVFMSLGASDLAYLSTGLPGLTFKARILPSPTASARVMRVTVVLDPSDTYDIKVTYPKRGDRFTEVVHFEREGVYNDALARTLLALDNVL
jgi:hypothetical protein